jgi:hypothetical protein
VSKFKHGYEIFIVWDDGPKGDNGISNEAYYLKILNSVEFSSRIPINCGNSGLYLH